MVDQKLSEALRGQYLAFDGPDGCGKSTIVGRLAADLIRVRTDAFAETVRQLKPGDPPTPPEQFDSAVHTTREPGGTEYGELMRDILLRPDVKSILCDEAEALMFMAARAQLVRERIKPLQERGYTILSDRYASSTFAYQCEASGVPWHMMLPVFALAVPQDLRPDLVVILDIPVDVSRARNIPKYAMQPVQTLTTGWQSDSVDVPERIEDRRSTDREAAHSAEQVVRDRIENKHGEYHAKVRRGYLKFARTFSNCAVVNADGDRDEVFNRVISVLRDWADSRLLST